MDDAVLETEEFDVPDGRIEDTDIITEMKDSFLDYSMSVIVSRALPDVRDGMKPVHRRILYSMASLNMGPNVAHKKSARIVGDVIAKYHPHGDTAVYDAMVRMAQDFSYRYPLVDGHGNFGSLDGDGAAAMRYTEARMSKISTEMVADLNKETVNLIETYDGDGSEPEILPSRVPNLLLNGSTGIAVGMATNIPTHNLRESVNAIKALIANPDLSTSELMEYIPGPDFPTGGIIMGRSGIKRAYETGRGNIPIRARYRIEEFDNGRKRIVFYEIPYQLNKANLYEKIANATGKGGPIQGVSRVNDESNREGIRIVVELKKGTQEEVVINQLFRLTPLQSNYSVNMLALQNGRPKQLSLKEIIQSYIDHQVEVIERRTQFNLKKAKERLHIVEGLRIALDHLDELITMIRNSHGPEDELIAQMNARFGLDEIQSKAILSMQIRRLSGLEREKIENEYTELVAQIADYEDILSNRQRVFGIITEDLDQMAERYGDARRTLIASDSGDTLDEDLIPNQDIIVTLTDSGYLKSQALENYHAQNRGGKGIRSTNLFDEDSIDRVVYMNNHDHLLLFTNHGRVYRLRGFDIPLSSRQAKGSSVINFIPLRENEKVKALLPFYKDPEKRKHFKYLFFVTENGIIKRTSIEEFKNIHKVGKKAITLNEGDEVAFIKPTTGEDEIYIASSTGRAVHFDERDIRPLSRAGTGVRGIQLKDGKVVGMELRREGDELVLLSENGIGKRIDADSILKKHRGNLGMLAFKVNENNGKLVGFRALQGDEDALVLTKNGIMIRVKANDFRLLSRSANGTKIIRLDPDDQVARLVLAPSNSVEEEIEEDVLTSQTPQDLQPEMQPAAEIIDGELVDKEDSAENEL